MLILKIWRVSFSVSSHAVTDSFLTLIIYKKITVQFTRNFSFKFLRILQRKWAIIFFTRKTDAKIYHDVQNIK